MHSLRSAAQYIEHPLDCRRLTLSVSFYHLHKEQVIEMAKMITQWTNDFTDNQFIFHCFCNTCAVKTKSLFPKMVDMLCKDKSLHMNYDAYIISSVINSISSMRRFQRTLATIHPVYSYGWDVEPAAWNVSIDYPTYFDERFPMERPSADIILNLVDQTFHEEGRIYRTLHKWADMTGGFCAEPYNSNSELFYGSAYISFSAFCLASFINETAELLAEFANFLSSCFVNLNAHVSLQPAETTVESHRTPYMKYFGTNLKMDGSHKENMCTVQEWYPTYYLCAIEWFNILSPLTSSHPVGILPKSPSNDVSVKKMTCGSIVVKSQKKIMDYGVADALEIKTILQSALYPGSSSITLRGMFPWQNTPRIYDWCPRNNWAIVPVEKHEIKIIGTDLVYISSSLKNNSF